MDKFGPNQTSFKQFGPTLISSVQYSNLKKSGTIGINLSYFGQVWTIVCRFGQVWTKSHNFVPIFTTEENFGLILGLFRHQVWTNQFRQVQTNYEWTSFIFTDFDKIISEEPTTHFKKIKKLTSLETKNQIFGSQITI